MITLHKHRKAFISLTKLKRNESGVSWCVLQLFLLKSPGGCLELVGCTICHLVGVQPRDIRAHKDSQAYPHSIVEVLRESPPCFTATPQPQAHHCWRAAATVAVRSRATHLQLAVTIGEKKQNRTGINRKDVPNRHH